MIAEGQRFTFVTRARDQRHYVVESVESHLSVQKGALAFLRNEETGRLAQVTQHWLEEGPAEDRGYWQREDTA